MTKILTETGWKNLQEGPTASRSRLDKALDKSIGETRGILSDLQILRSKSDTVDENKVSDIEGLLKDLKKWSKKLQ